ncbi:transcriptional regulator [[Pseudomonas] boreopolis]|uniref:Uncharacterized protein n=1 Tax=Xanthomonas boreopolis TaxID=86183 RepID=A0A919F7V7_9XANT|nr:hypothetical protein GCM10009090_17880 [[Pseudomonas] boreopolis]
MSQIERVINEAGGVSALARVLGVQPPTVHQWKTGDRPVPARHALAISRAWPDLVSIHDLRPDVFGPKPEQGEGDRAA